MKNQRIAELINKKIDGIITPDEAHELDNYIASDAEAGKYQSQMIELSHRLESAEKVNPPAELKRNVMSSISAGKIAHAPADSRAANLLTHIKQAFHIRPGYAFAFGIAAGLLLTLSVISSFNFQKGRDLSEMTGTIVLNKGGNDFGPVDLIKIAENQISAKLETKSNGSLVLATIDIDSPAELALQIDFNPAQLSFEGFTQSRSLSGPVKISDRKVELDHSGENRYLLVFQSHDQKNSPISVSLISKDGILQRYLKTNSTENQ